MGQAVIGGRVRLIKVTNLITSKAIEELVDMRLPLIDGLPIADELG
jgi:hypothetical protein